MAFDIEGARSAGYSEAEIAGFLAQREGFDLAKATQAGYQPGDVIGFLSERAAQKAGSPPLSASVAASTPARSSAAPAFSAADRKGPAAQGTWDDPREGSWDDRGEARKGVESAVTGIKAMGPAAKVAGSSLVINRIGERLANWDKIDKGETVPRAEGLAYQRADAEGRQKMRQELLGMVAQQKDFVGESVKLVRQYQQEQVRNKGKTADFTDIEDVKGFTDWLAFNGAAGAVYLAPVMLSAAVGGPVGAGAVSYGLAAGEINADRVAAAIDMNKPGRFKNPDRQDSVDSTQGIASRVASTVPSTLAFAAPNAALDVVAGPVRGVITKPLKGLTKGETLKAAPGMVGRDIVEEGVTGALQEGVNIAAERYVGEQQGDILTKENAKRVVNAAAAEAAGGMVGGSVNAGVALSTAPAVKTPEQTAAPVLAAGSVDEAISAAQRETSAPLPAAPAPAQVTAITPSAAAPVANPQASAAVDRIAEILGQSQETVNASNPVGAAVQPAGGGGLGGAVDVGGLDDRGLQPGVTGGGRGLPAAAPVAAGVGAAGAGALIPQTVWFGRRGDGYATAQDAEAALPSRQRARADLDWKVEPTPEGRFRLAGYGEPGAAPAQTTAQGFRLAMNPTGTLTVQGDPNAIRAVLQAAGVDKVAVSPSGVMVGVSQAQQAMQVLDPQVRETTERIQALERAAPQTAPQAAPALESADSRFPPGSMPQAVPAQVPPQPAGAPEIGMTAPTVQDMQAAPPAAPAEVPAEPQFKATLNPSGTLTIKGDPEAIKAILKDAGITGVRRADGVLVGKSQAQAAQKLPALQTSGAERAEADRRTEEDTRARADAQRGEFTLQGSDRAADANPAQQDAFDADMRAKPFDHGELNIPGRTNRIDADLDRYKAEQAKIQKADAKQATAKRKTDKAQAKEVFAEVWPAMLEKMGPKFGERQLRETLDSMVKWEPAKFLAMAEKFRKEQGGKDAFDSVMRHRAFHGTPHDFDRFTTEKIGTGEGAQAYGWGIYLAENEAVAEGYRKKLTDHARGDAAVWEFNGKRVVLNEWVRDAHERHPELTAAEASDAAFLASQFVLGARPTPKRENLEAAKLGKAIMSDMAGIKPVEGQLYEVDIPDAVVAKMLLWDKPLRDQPESVQKALRTIINESPSKVTWDDVVNNGQDWKDVKDNVLEMLGDEEISRRLAALGVPGVKYLDGGSRNRPLKDVKREFLAELPEDADFDEVLDLLGSGTFSPKNEAILKELAANDWLGFDYPAQAISAALSPDLANYDASDALVKAVEDAQKDATYNLVVFNEKNVTITHKDGSPVTKKERDDFLDEALRRGDSDNDRAPARTREVSTSRVQAIVDELAGNWKDGPQITVVESVADLPGDHPADTRGLYQRGRVWIVADAYAHGSRKGIAKTLAHEAVAHYGLRDMLGRQDWTQLMDRIQLGIETKNKPLTSLRDRVREAYRDEDGGYSLSPEQEADEIAALAVEDAIDADGNFRPGFSMFKAVFAKVAQFLRDLGIDIAFTNAELQGMLVLSMRGLQVGERTAGGGRMVLGGSPAARARTGARAVAAWQEVTETEFGPEYTRDGLQLLPLGEKDTSTDLAENSLPLGHAAHVEDGNKVYDFAIARDGELVGRATLEVGADGQIAAVHDIVVDGRRNGVGRAVMEAVLASAKDSVRIIDIVPAAEAFWDKMGSGARDVYANATADWQTYEAARPQPRGEGRGARNDAQAEQGRPGKGDAATEGEDEGFDGTLRARAGVQADPVGGTSQDEDGWQMPEATRGDRVLYELQDGRIDLRRAVEAIKASGREIEERFDARQAETLFPGRVAYRSQTFLEQEVKPLLTFMAANRVKIDEISDYLIARHAPERNAQVAKVNPDMPDGGAGRNSEGTLMTTKAAEEYLAGIDPARSKVLESTAARIDAITAGTRQILVQEGLEKPGVVGAWESAYKFYAPLFKDEADAGTPHPIGTGFTIKGPASKRATGSTRQVTDVLGHVLMQREAAITRAEKNRVGMSLYGMVLAYPNPDFWVAIRPGMAKGALRAQLTAMGVDPDEVTAAMDGVPTVRTVDEKTNKVVERPNPLYKSLPGAIVLKVAGEDRVIMFNQKDQRAMRLADSMKNLDGLTKLDIAGSLIGKATRWIASVNTQYNPVFGFVNVVRDLQNGIVNLTSTQLSGHKAEILGNVPAALIGIARDLRDDSKRTEWSDLFVRFQDAGGKTGYRELFRDAADRTKEIERELKQLDAAGSLSIGRGAHAVLDLLDDFNTALENAVRLSAFKAGLDAGISEAESARIARELTVDFNRRGRTGREIGPLYAFFNASMQGTARTIATLKGPAGAKIIAGGVAIGIMQALMLAAAGFEDDDLPEFIKTRNLIIPTAWRSDRKTYIAIPLGLGLHVLPNTGRILTEIVLGGGKRLGRKLQDALGEIVGAFNPMGSANPFTLDGALKTAAPTVVDPIIELGFNKNFAGGQIQRQPFSEEGDNRPGFTRARESTQRSTTGQVYLGISKAINAATGGSAYEAGLASPTPEAVRYLAQVAGGGVLREFEKSVNAIADAAAGRPVKLNAIPLTGRFFGEVDSDAVETRRYFDAKNRISKAQSSLKAAERAGDREEYRRILRKTAELSHYEALQETQRSISALNKLAVENVSDPVRAKQIDAARISEMRELNEALRRLEARPPAKVD